MLMRGWGGVAARSLILPVPKGGLLHVLKDLGLKI